jgi:hypothetical protein
VKAAKDGVDESPRYGPPASRHLQFSRADVIGRRNAQGREVYLLERGEFMDAITPKSQRSSLTEKQGQDQRTERWVTA